MKTLAKIVAGIAIGVVAPFYICTCRPIQTKLGINDDFRGAYADIFKSKTPKELRKNLAAPNVGEYPEYMAPYHLLTAAGLLSLPFGIKKIIHGKPENPYKTD